MTPAQYNEYQRQADVIEQAKKWKEEQLMGVIDTLRELNGETVQWLLEQSGQSDQMLRQLIMTSNMADVNGIYNKRVEYEIKTYDWYDNDVAYIRK
jgi:hypothetical protein